MVSYTLTAPMNFKATSENYPKCENSTGSTSQYSSDNDKIIADYNQLGYGISSIFNIYNTSEKSKLSSRIGVHMFGKTLNHQGQHPLV